MSFLAPSMPAPPQAPPPPPNPPVLASGSVQQSQAASRAARIAAAGSMGFSDTVKTSPLGDTTRGKQSGKAVNSLLGGTAGA